MKQPQSLGRQVNVLINLLNGLKEGTKNEAVFKQTTDWIRDLPEHVRPVELFAAYGQAFDMTEDEARKFLFPPAPGKEAGFESLVPTVGWLRDYVEYTRNTEPPTVFHFFVGAVMLGAVMKRNVHFDRGNGRLYPNINVILVAPSGVCRKTSCCELGIKLIRDTSVTIIADKVTPEAMLQTYEDANEATGLIYAGELRQFLGNQKYMEGMVPLLTRLMDCPDVWSVRTVGRGELILRNVGFSMLGASTMDWLRALPTDSFGGGFMSRFLLVVQESSPRSFPLPPPLPEYLKVRLQNRLRDLEHTRAKMTLTPNAEAWYRKWYNARRHSSEEKLFAGYFERKPDNMLRLAMVLSISEDDGHSITKLHLEQSLAILNWAEEWLPAAFGQLGSNLIGETHTKMIVQLKRAGGSLKHSDWLRKNSQMMKRDAFKQHVETLRECKLVDFDSGVYYLTPEGWKQ